MAEAAVLDGRALTLPPGVAWRRAVGMVLLLWIVLGLACFGALARVIATRNRQDQVFGAFLLDLAFAVAALIVVGAIVWWQRNHGETLRELGWRLSTPRRAIVAGVIYGLVWTSLTYSRGSNPLAIPWERPLMAVIGIWLAFAEELAIRGFLMEQLRRGGVRPWQQVVASGVAMGSYHGVIGFSYSPLYAVSSAVLFAGISMIFIYGRRSLTPGLVAHASAHALGDPALTQGIIHAVLAAA